MSVVQFMAEIWRVIPANGMSPTQPFTDRESLDRTMAFWRKTAEDRTRRPSERAAARALMLGRIQVAANVTWVDSE